jgi:AAA15 family ATPase/GTPase
MLIRFVVSNFLSFDKETEFNMLAGSFRTHKHHVYQQNNLNILKSAAIYGANGAGKSNLVKAIAFLQETVKNGKIDNTARLKKFKLNPENANLPTEFEIEFSTDDKIYSYGISINNDIIEKEWLYETGSETKNRMIFERTTEKNGKIKIEFDKIFLKSPKNKLLKELLEENILKPNELLLSKHEEIKNNDIDNSFTWFIINLAIVFPDINHFRYNSISGLPSVFKEFNNDLLKSFNTGISKLEIENVDFDDFFGKEEYLEKIFYIKEIEKKGHAFLPKKIGNFYATKEKNKYVVKKVYSVHNNSENNSVNFEIKEESEGTQRLIDYIFLFYGLKLLGRTIIIDEIDQSIHPVLLIELVKKIMEDENTNGQLIFTTHESNLMDLNILRQDEIWFSEKNESGSTQFYSLSDFKPRYDLDIRKGYLQGRFGAIPFIGDLKNLKFDENDA